MASSKLVSVSTANSDLPRDSSICSLSTLIADVDKHHHITMDDLLKNIYNDLPHPSPPPPDAGGASAAAPGRTVEEVWKEIVAGGGGEGEDASADGEADHVRAGAGGVGLAEMTLEDFLTRAGAVREEDVGVGPGAVVPMGYGQYQVQPPPQPQGQLVYANNNGTTSGGGGGGRGTKRRAVQEAPLDKATQQKQRRMIKNRESAARSRKRKQAYINELEALVMKLEEENALLLIEEVDGIPSTMQLEFADVCPPEMRPYILDVKDVPRDGHCGFRAIASFMGYSEDVGWVKVRKDLTNELLLNSFHYAQLFGSDERVNELLDALACSESICLEKKHWMTMPDMGHIIASCYNIVLIHLSSAQCFTFFPLRTAPISISVSSPIEIVVGFVDDHFMQVYLKKGHPMPPPIPAPTRKNPHLATIWESFHEQRSTEWATPYLSRIEQFISLQPEVVSQNPVYLDLL